MIWRVPHHGAAHRVHTWHFIQHNLVVVYIVTHQLQLQVSAHHHHPTYLSIRPATMGCCHWVGVSLARGISGMWWGISRESGGYQIAWSWLGLMPMHDNATAWLQLGGKHIKKAQKVWVEGAANGSRCGKGLAAWVDERRMARRYICFLGWWIVTN